MQSFSLCPFEKPAKRGGVPVRSVQILTAFDLTKVPDSLPLLVGERGHACGDYALQSPHLRREQVGVAAGFDIDSHAHPFPMWPHFPAPENGTTLES